MHASAASLASLVLLLAGTQAIDGHAATYTVGVGTGCSHPNVQAAVDAAAANPGADLIRISRSVAHTAQAIRISDQELTLEGGFPDCTSGASGVWTVLDGTGGESTSVVTITGASGAVTMRRLRIIGGDEVGDGDGGGIDHSTSLSFPLLLEDVEISGNRARDGGGIAVGGAATIGRNVRIFDNRATRSGGGISITWGRLRIDGDGVLIGYNTAASHGGGINVEMTTGVDIGSPGWNGLGVIHGNSARYGGGMSIRAGALAAHPALARLYTTSTTRPVRISSNVASATGGGVYLDPYIGIDMRSAYAILCASDVRIDSNRAVQGAAIYADTDYNALGHLRSSAAMINPGHANDCLGIAPRPAHAVRCTGSPDCNRIDGNIADGDDNAGTGAVVLIQNASRFRATNTYWSTNSGGHLIRGFGEFDGPGANRAIVSLVSCVIEGNSLSREMLRFEDSQLDARLERCTIAGNTYGEAMMRFAQSKDMRLDLLHSIVWQPGTVLRSGSPPATSAVEWNVLHTNTTLGSTAYTLVADPRFVGDGDYGLRAGSPAVDYSPAVGGDDLAGNARSRDLPIKANVWGPTDVGAFERQTLAPLVVNADFDTGLGQWSTVTPGVTIRDAALNATGAAGSGSAKITQTNVAYGQAIRGVQQCVHLPGPGLYAINGSGRGTGTITTGGDIAQLHWEFRRTAGEACTQGAANASGTLTLSNSGSWSRPANPALLNVTAQEWTASSAILVTLVGVESGTSSSPRTLNTWFDGISVTPAGSDRIFADGFER